MLGHVTVSNREPRTPTPRETWQPPTATTTTPRLGPTPASATTTTHARLPLGHLEDERAGLYVEHKKVAKLGDEEDDAVLVGDLSRL